MIRDVPRPALMLGLAGLTPMLWGVGEIYLPPIRSASETWISSWFYAPHATLRYAGIILAFMSGVLWGFAAKATGPSAAKGYTLSVLPALYSYLFVLGDTQMVALRLAVGFVLVLGLDAYFHRQALTPGWWMRLRVVLTGGMVICLLAIAGAPADLLARSG